jgi:hypothetical protein
MGAKVVASRYVSGPFDGLAHERWRHGVQAVSVVSPGHSAGQRHSRGSCKPSQAAVRTFSTTSRPPCGRPPAAAVLGRQHHDAHLPRASPFTPGGMTSDWCHAASSPPRLTGSCPYPGTGVVFALLDRAIKYQRLYRHRSAGLEGAATLRRLRGLRVVRIGSP